MKKYVASVSSNDKLKKKAVNELTSLMYRIEKGRFNKEIDSISVSNQRDALKQAVEDLNESVGTGSENIYNVSQEVFTNIKKVQTAMNQPVTNRFDEACEDLLYAIIMWKDIVNGAICIDTDEMMQKERISWSRKRLINRLSELETVKSEFISSSYRLEEQIRISEADLAELDKRIILESNERKMNDLYREVKSVKSKIDMFYVRKSNYNACYNLLEMICSDVKEIISAAAFAPSELAKAKVLLNVEKIKRVIVEPDKAITVLRQINEDLKVMAAKTASIDNRINSMDNENTIINQEALKYKESLLKAQREKEQNSLSGAFEQSVKEKKKQEVE